MRRIELADADVKPNDTSQDIIATSHKRKVDAVVKPKDTSLTFYR